MILRRRVISYLHMTHPLHRPKNYSEPHAAAAAAPAASFSPANRNLLNLRSAPTGSRGRRNEKGKCWRPSGAQLHNRPRRALSGPTNLLVIADEPRLLLSFNAELCASWICPVHLNFRLHLGGGKALQVHRDRPPGRVSYRRRNIP